MNSNTLLYTETILPKDIPVYVLGEVQADRSIGKPAAGSKNRVFVVSQKSEEERTKALCADDDLAAGRRHRAVRHRRRARLFRGAGVDGPRV